MEFDFEKQPLLSSGLGIAGIAGKPPLYPQPKIHTGVASLSESTNLSGHTTNSFDEEMVFQLSTLRAFLALGFFLIALSFREIYFAKEDNIKLERGVASALKNLDEKIIQSEQKVSQQMKELSFKLEEKTNSTSLKINEFSKETISRQKRIDELSAEIKKLTLEKESKEEPAFAEVVYKEDKEEKKEVLPLNKTPESSIPILQQPPPIMKKSNRKKKESQTNKSNSSNKAKSREIAL